VGSFFNGVQFSPAQLDRFQGRALERKKLDSISVALVGQAAGVRADHVPAFQPIRGLLCRL
jgi:hypothetical protein